MNALEAINLSKTYSATDGFFLKNKKNIRAVNDITFTMKENQTQLIRMSASNKVKTSGTPIN